ncbi:hypothetical protein NLJ89_g7864 [Agrocybe chaxingu]|uniref:Uncharacterized protein n=1 Tax=Agrocybe chaxingu TaxID=84603 RepID=A0A9W8JWC5_9AGAR|nr:hypothetical protein NLJ89_g7864 [Agrocybe chaxingu]
MEGIINVSSESPPSRTTILGSFLRGRPRNSSQSHIQVNTDLHQPHRDISPSTVPQPPSPNTNGSSRRRTGAATIAALAGQGSNNNTNNTGTSGLGITSMLRRRPQAQDPMSVEELLQNQMLSWRDKALCLAGKENLWEMQRTVTHTFLLNFQPSPQCSTGCKMRMPTSFTLEDFEVLRTSPHLLEEYQDWTGLRLCAKCQAFAQAQHREGREKVWQKLPGLFHLGTWDDIFKDQSC